jgi:hypothetical protein
MSGLDVLLSLAVAATAASAVAKRNACLESCIC